MYVTRAYFLLLHHQIILFTFYGNYSSEVKRRFLRLVALFVYLLAVFEGRSLLNYSFSAHFLTTSDARSSFFFSEGKWKFPMFLYAWLL